MRSVSRRFRGVGPPVYAGAPTADRNSEVEGPVALRADAVPSLLVLLVLGAHWLQRVPSGLSRAAVALALRCRALGAENVASALCHGHHQVAHLRVLRLEVDG
jgi:hypothetical protein